MNSLNKISLKKSASTYLDKQLKYPGSPLIKKPFIRVKVIEAKDIYVNQNNSIEECDPYCVISYGKNQNYKTQ